jgi:hypothetical protein
MVTASVQITDDANVNNTSTEIKTWRREQEYYIYQTQISGKRKKVTLQALHHVQILSLQIQAYAVDIC